MAVALLLVAGAAIAALAWPSGGLRDDEVVYCLAEERQPRLASAAVVLGLAHGASADRLTVSTPTGNEELLVTDWRVRFSADFKRACLALSPPRPAGPDTAGASLLATMNVLVGALLGFLATQVQQSRARRRELARSVQSALSGYDAAAREYLRRWTDPGDPSVPSPAALDQRRIDLVAELRRVRVGYPKLTATQRALEQLEGGQLGEGMSSGWPQGDADRVRARRDALAPALGRLADLAEAVAKALEHPWRSGQSVAAGAVAPGSGQ